MWPQRMERIIESTTRSSSPRSRQRLRQKLCPKNKGPVSHKKSAKLRQIADYPDWEPWFKSSLRIVGPTESESSPRKRKQVVGTKSNSPRNVQLVRTCILREHGLRKNSIRGRARSGKCDSFRCATGVWKIHLPFRDTTTVTIQKHITGCACGLNTC